MMHTIFIPNWRPTLNNELLGCHYRTAARLKSGDMQMISAYARQCNVPKATGRRSVKIILTCPRGRLPDPDAPFKSTHDALKRLGYLIDDDSKWMELIPAEFRRGPRSTTIEIGDL